MNAGKLLLNYRCDDIEFVDNLFSKISVSAVSDHLAKGDEKT